MSQTSVAWTDGTGITKHLVSGEIDVPGGQLVDGALVAQGGRTGGWALLASAGRVTEWVSADHVGGNEVGHGREVDRKRDRNGCTGAGRGKCNELLGFACEWLR